VLRTRYLTESGIYVIFLEGVMVIHLRLTADELSALHEALKSTENSWKYRWHAHKESETRFFAWVEKCEGDGSAKDPISGYDVQLHVAETYSLPHEGSNVPVTLDRLARILHAVGRFPA